MTILVLGPANETLVSILQEYGHQIIKKESPINVQLLEENKIDFVVSHGYRHIIKSDVLNQLKDRIINLHISYLPWNRGADPNLWSFLEDTPKGVTIHFMDEGIDTGDIIAQKKVSFSKKEKTLATTYTRLQKEIICLFREQWPFIEKGSVPSREQPFGGSFHKLSDKDKFKYLLTKGWDTPVELLRGKALIKLK